MTVILFFSNFPSGHPPSLPTPQFLDSLVQSANCAKWDCSDSPKGSRCGNVAQEKQKSTGRPHTCQRQEGNGAAAHGQVRKKVRTKSADCANSKTAEYDPALGGIFKHYFCRSNSTSKGTQYGCSCWGSPRHHRHAPPRAPKKVATFILEMYPRCRLFKAVPWVPTTRHFLRQIVMLGCNQVEVLCAKTRIQPS